MVVHHAYLRLREPWTTADGLRSTVRAIRNEVASLPGPPPLTVGFPADGHARAAWDLALTLTFTSSEHHAVALASPDWQTLETLFAERSVVAKGWSFATG